MKTNIHANIGIEIEFHKLINPYFSNNHCYIAISGLFASDLITLPSNHLRNVYNKSIGFSMSIKINISDEILEVCPHFKFAAIECKVKNSHHNEMLWSEIDNFITTFSKEYKMENIKNRPTIAATREVYKKLGKDPNRYRPSGEALCRRILKGQGLYQIDTLVDLINLISLKTGYSIGGFDADKIEGDVTLGVGKSDEPFEAIGRGSMNIEGLPVYRDNIGGIGNPSSDEERTKITADTSRLLMLINGYSGEKGLKKAVDLSLGLLRKYASAEDFDFSLISYEFK